MDPTACFQRLVDALAECARDPQSSAHYVLTRTGIGSAPKYTTVGPYAEAYDALDDLLEWIAKGGHLPEQVEPARR